MDFPPLLPDSPLYVAEPGIRTSSDANGSF